MDMEKGNFHSVLEGMQLDIATMEKSIQVPQNFKIDLPHNPAIPLLGFFFFKKVKH